MTRRNLAAAAMLAFLAGCGPTPPGTWTGYVEADTLTMAPREGGTLAELLVAEGDTVALDQPLFRLDTERHEAALAAAEAKHAAASARLEDIAKPARPDEIDTRAEALAEARAAETLAERDLARAEDLARKGTIPAAGLDAARAALEAAVARRRQAESALALARLPARPDAIAAAEAEVRAALAAVTAARLDLEDRAVSAPRAATVESIVRRPGETMPGGAAVLTLLPTDGLLMRFFVGEASLSGLALGRAVAASCDGCAAPIRARISYIAREPQFTPPVIYSRDEREKLVYLVEARIVPGEPPVRPGQPLDIALAAP